MNSNADTLRSSFARSKEIEKFDEKHKKILDRVWNKQYSIETKEYPSKMISPRASSNINSIAGNQLHQALNLPSSFVGSSTTGSTFGMMPQFFTEN